MFHGVTKSQTPWSHFHFLSFRMNIVCLTPSPPPQTPTHSLSSPHLDLQSLPANPFSGAQADQSGTRILLPGRPRIGLWWTQWHVCFTVQSSQDNFYQPHSPVSCFCWTLSCDFMLGWNNSKLSWRTHIYMDTEQKASLFRMSQCFRCSWGAFEHVFHW